VGNEKGKRVRGRVSELKERKKEMEREKIGWGNEKDVRDRVRVEEVKEGKRIG
jgi:hypothetical protein